MNCDWYEKQVDNDSVDLWPDGEPSSLLSEHARTCITCDSLVKRESELRRQLEELAQRTQALQPSPSVRKILLAELDSVRSTYRPRRERLLYYALAMAAVICLIVVLVVGNHPPVPAPAVANAPAETPALPITPQTNPAPSPLATRVAQHRESSHRPSSVSPPSPRNDFYPVVMCDSVTCAGPALTVRVQLPRSPLSTRSSNTPVTADLLVGEDGLVRGVRLLQ